MNDNISGTWSAATPRTPSGSLVVSSGIIMIIIIISSSSSSMAIINVIMSIISMCIYGDYDYYQ